MESVSLIAIQCPSEEVMKNVVQFGRQIGKVNPNAAIVLDWDRHKENTCIVLGWSSVMYGSRQFFVNQCYAIMQAKDFMKNIDSSKYLLPEYMPEIGKIRPCHVESKVYVDQKMIPLVFQGFFHRWGSEFTVCTIQGVVASTVGIVEDSTGQVHCIYPPHIKFSK